MELMYRVWKNGLRTGRPRSQETGQRKKQETLRGPVLVKSYGNN